jgi:cytochrome c-type biogenesis protein
MRRNRKYMGHVEKAMGVMLIGFALLIATNSIAFIAEAMIRWFPAFATIG